MLFLPLLNILYVYCARSISPAGIYSRHREKASLESWKARGLAQHRNHSIFISFADIMLYQEVPVRHLGWLSQSEIQINKQGNLCFHWATWENSWCWCSRYTLTHNTHRGAKLSFHFNDIILFCRALMHEWNDRWIDPIHDCLRHSPCYANGSLCLWTLLRVPAQCERSSVFSNRRLRELLYAFVQMWFFC